MSAPAILIPLAPGFEELEAITLIDILRRAALNVTSAGLEEARVVGAHNIPVIADTTLNKVLDQSFDMIVLPGGLPGADHLAADTRLRAMLQKHASNDAYLGAICAAPKALLEAGLLKQRKLTAYPGLLDELAAQHETQVSSDAVVADGKIITSKGPGTAMPFALTIVETLCGTDARKELAGALQTTH